MRQFSKFRPIALIVLLLTVCLPAYPQATVLRVKKLNNVRKCDVFAVGSTAGAQITSCIADLPSTGGTADARGIEGAQSWTSDPFTGITKNVDLWLGSGTLTVSANVTIPSNITIRWHKGTTISISMGSTLTINGWLNGINTNAIGGAGTLVIGNGVNYNDYSQSVDLLSESTTLVNRPVNQYMRSYTGTVSTRALTGSVTMSNGNTAVTGSSTLFLTQVAAGNIIRLTADGDAAWAKVASVTNDTALTLSAVYAGTGGSGAAVAGLAHLPFAIRDDITGGNPNTSQAGESVGLSVLSYRYGGSRIMFGINSNQGFAQRTRGAASAEFDLGNFSGVDWNAGGVTLNGENNQAYAVRAISSGSSLIQGHLLIDGYASPSAQYGININGAGAVANIFAKGACATCPQIMLSPAADNANAAIVLNNALNNATKGIIYNDGTAQFSAIYPVTSGQALGTTSLPWAMTTNSLTIGTTGSNSPILNHYSGTGSLDFAAWAGSDCQDITFTVNGVVDGDTVYLGVPNALASVAGVHFTGFVSAPNTVRVRGCKITAGASADPAAATVRADVWHH